MTGAVIITHGNLARELLATAAFIAGELPNVKALSVDLSQSSDKAKKNIQAAIKQVDAGHGVLILTDMFGGTPSNIAISFHESERIEVVTGVNLPMIIRFSQIADKKCSIVEIAADLVKYAKRGITHVTALLE